MLQLRIGLFFGAATVVSYSTYLLDPLSSCRVKAGAFSGVLAYAISFMAGIRGLEGWSWFFVSAQWLFIYNRSSSS